VSDVIDMEQMQQWIGKQQQSVDTVTAVPIMALRATLDQPDVNVKAGHQLPELWHWLYFLPLARQSEIGADGHPERGGFLPPVPLPRRMWAGSQFTFNQPVRVGDFIKRTSTIENVTHKTGKSGDLVFVRVKHDIKHIDRPQDLNTTANNTIAITEFHDIVYRQAPQPDAKPPAPKAAPESADWEHLIETDDVLLFRYSALTFNGHRIHYDRRYVTEVEGYPGLIVHGPLIATLLLEQMRKALHDAVITHYEFKALKPVFDTHPFYACGSVKPDNNTVQLWAKDHHGNVTMEAVATITKHSA